MAWPGVRSSTSLSACLGRDCIRMIACLLPLGAGLHATAPVTAVDPALQGLQITADQMMHPRSQHGICSPPANPSPARLRRRRHRHALHG
jgi:hypothetical protein